MRQDPRTISRMTLIGSGAVFGIFTGLAHFDADDFSRLDAFATSSAHAVQSIPWLMVWVALTAIGSTVGIVLLTFLAAVFLRRSPMLLLRLLIALIGSSVSVQVVKLLVARARPETLAWIGPIHSYSFPSGHATSAMAFFGFLAILSLSVRHRLIRILAPLVCIGFILAIGASRIVLGAHYASDVLAGYVLGLFWVALAFLIPSYAKREYTNGI